MNCPQPANPVPDWLQIVSAVSTPIGVVLTLATVIVALTVALGDRRRYEKEDTAHRRAQARLIRQTDTTDGDDCIVYIRNHSQSPIFDLEIIYPEHPDPAVTPHLGGGNVTNIDTLEPGEMRQTFFRFMANGAIGRDREKYPPDSVRFKFDFTDANGIRWRREGKNEPVEVLEPIEPTIRHETTR